MPDTIDVPIPEEDCFPGESSPKWKWSLNKKWFSIFYEGEESDIAATIPTSKLKEALDKLDVT